MKNNQVLNNVQDKINKIKNYSYYIGKKGVIILDKLYKIITIEKVDTSFNFLETEDGRGRVKGDKTFVLIPEGQDIGWERADIAFPGDTIVRNDGVEKKISNIEGSFIYFDDSTRFDTTRFDIKNFSDYLSDIYLPEELTITKSKDVVPRKQDDLKSELTLQQKINNLKLIPLFADKNYNYSVYSITDNMIIIEEIKEYANLAFTIICEFNLKQKTIISGRISEIKNPSNEYANVLYSIEDKINLPKLINVFNEKYSELATKFNEMLMNSLKEELEKEKQKKEKEESQKGESQEDQEGQGGEGQESQSQEGEGQESQSQEGESQEGESEEGQVSQEGKGNKDLSSKDIQKLIDELNKDISKENIEGQSQKSKDSIDLEDFLEEVDKNQIDNDFTQQYNNKDLKEKIDKEKNDNFDKELESLFPDNQNNIEKYQVKSVLNALKSLFNIDNEEIKRRFPNDKSISGFISTLNKKELKDLSDIIGIPNYISDIEKRKVITNNLLTDLQNI